MKYVQLFAVLVAFLSLDIRSYGQTTRPYPRFYVVNNGYTPDQVHSSTPLSDALYDANWIFLGEAGPSRGLTGAQVGYIAAEHAYAECQAGRMDANDIMLTFNGLGRGTRIKDGGVGIEDLLLYYLVRFNAGC